MIDEIVVARFFRKEALLTSHSYTYLLELKQLIAPNGQSASDSVFNFVAFVEYLNRHPNHADILSQYLKNVFGQLSFIRVFTELGIPRTDSFLQQVFTRLTGHLLPEYKERGQLEFIFEVLFPTRKDAEWVGLIENDILIHFLQLLKISEIYKLPNNNSLLLQILNAIEVTSLRIASLGISVEVVEKLPELEQFGSPFMSQVYEISTYVQKFNQDNFDRSTQNRDYRQIMILIDQCDDYLKRLTDKSQLNGVSLKLTNYILRLIANLKRLRLLLYLITQHNDEKEFNEEVIFLKKLVLSHARDKSILYLLQTNLEMILYQMTLHSSRVGQNYIATSKLEMLKMFISSAGGGVIVAFLSMIKLVLYRINFSYFFQGFAFSLNYAFGFSLIHVLSFRLATKQPAMTASHIAEAIDIVEKDRDKSLSDLRLITRQLLQSQLIAFIGNVVLAIPVAFIVSILFFKVTGATFANDLEALHIVSDLNPFSSLSVYYAAIAGFYLFLSGLIASYFENFNIRNNIAKRVKYITYFRSTKLSKKLILKVSNYLDRNLAAIVGNIALGFFLGFSVIIGKIFGIPLDIRHITFAAGNLGIALANPSVSFSSHDLILAILGVLFIGLFNFIFSFTPSLIIAMLSRGVSMRFFLNFFNLIKTDFMQGPLKFFIPLKSKLELLKREKNDS
jgi:site-specific recombinase